MANFRTLIIAIFSAVFGTYLFLTRVKQPEPVKKKKEEDPNDPFYRGPRPDPFVKPGKSTFWPNFDLKHEIFEQFLMLIR